MRNALEVEQYTAFAEMLERAKLDVVSICTPDYMHREHFLLALDAKCHVLCEKPLATSMEDALAMVQAADRSGHTVMVCHQFRWTASFWEAKRRCEAGELGTVFYLESDFLQNEGYHPERAAIRRTGQSGRVGSIAGGSGRSASSLPGGWPLRRGRIDWTQADHRRAGGCPRRGSVPGRRGSQQARTIGETRGRGVSLPPSG